MMNQNCCWVTCVLMGLGWLLVASFLLHLTWNKVIIEQTRWKKTKFWQALLFVATIAVFALPCALKSKRGCGHHGHSGSSCPYSSGDTTVQAGAAQESAPGAPR